MLQTLAVREGMASTGGNEVVVAMLFGTWMVLTAAGAAWGRRGRARRPRVAAALVLYAVVLPATILAARAGAVLLAPGELPSVAASTLACAVVLGPACLLAGWIYAQLASGAHEPIEVDLGTRSARAYLLDTLGSGLAGLLLALWLLDRALAFQLAGVAAAGSLLAAAALLGSWGARALALSGALLAVVMWRAPLDKLTYRWHAPGQRVESAHSSSRGALVVASAAGQVQLLLEREPVLTVPDVQNAEWLTHVPLALHPAPKQVLVLGVAPAGALGLMRQHGAEQVDEVVGEARIAELVRTLDGETQTPGVQVRADDERGWLRGTAQRYDVAIVAAMPPTSVSGARLFSLEFYRELRGCLKPGGLVVVRAPAHASYAGLEQRRMHSAVASTLRVSFSHLEVVPGQDTLYVASDGPLPPADSMAALIERRLADRSIRAVHVHSGMLADVLSQQRTADARKWASLSMPVSTDVHPIVYRLALDAALAHLGEGGNWVLRVLALVIAGLALVWFNPRSRPVSFSLATTGFAGLALQLLLMIVYQTAVAALYRDVALVTAAFMAASCVGTWWGSTLAPGRRAMVLADLGQLAIAVMLALGAAHAIAVSGIVARLAVVLAGCLIGGASGVQIALASRCRELSPGAPGGTVYAIDLMGAAFAALVVYTLLVPALGIAGAALCVAGLKAVSAGALLVAARQPQKMSVAAPGPAIALVVVVALGLIDSTEQTLYTLTVSRAYGGAVLALLLGMLAMAFQPPWLRAALVRGARRWGAFSRNIALSPSRALELLVLLPLAALPLARCYFKLPYLFCHVCPRPCAFGILRPYLVPAALLANLDDRRFCEKACPLGQAQRACARARPRHLPSLGAFGWGARLTALGLTALLYPLILHDRQTGLEGSGTFAWLFVNSYTASAWVLGAFGVLLAASFFVQRPFCDGACPIGAASELLARAEKKWLVRRPQRDAEDEQGKPVSG
jgi:spermidine synthase